MEKLTILIPTYNEEELLENVIRSIPLVSLKAIGLNPEILIINTSTDHTEQIARVLGTTVINESRPGYGRAYKTGFENVNEGLIATFDADRTYPPNELIKMIRTYRQANDCLTFISGNRFAWNDKDAFRPLNWFGNKLFNIIIYILFKIKLKDSQSGMWLTSKDAIKTLTLIEDSMALSTEIKLEAKQKLKFIEVPIGYKKRPNYAKLKPWNDGKKILRFLLKRRFKKWMKQNSEKRQG